MPGASLVRIAELLFFMAPAYLADMAPPFVKYWPWWNRPIAERWLGSHKTVVGFAFGVAAAVVTTFVQWRIAWRGAITSYDDWLVLGLLFGVGAMAGDSLKSLLKRRIGIAPGHPWVPADQLDYVVGALALVWSRVSLSVGDVLVIALLSFAGQLVVTRIGYWLGVRDVTM
jgi:CDP-2,3-bis-(O-geranylgeranyl)-sn-glycerol synthase